MEDWKREYLSDLWIHDAILTNIRPILAQFVSEIPTHTCFSDVLNSILFVIVDWLMDTLHQERHCQFTPLKEDYIGSCQDFDLQGSFSMASWAMFYGV